MAGQAKQLQERLDSSENHTKDEKMLPSVRVTSVDVRQRPRELCPEEADGLSAQPEEVPSKARH